MAWDIEFYQTEDGKCNVEEFLDGLTVKLQAKTMRSIELLELYGNELRFPYTDHVVDNIWELRTKQSSNITRILYFIFTNKKIILLNGFVKKDDKTPEEEKNKAKKYYEDYLRRYNV